MSEPSNLGEYDRLLKSYVDELLPGGEEGRSLYFNCATIRASLERSASAGLSVREAGVELVKCLAESLALSQQCGFSSYGEVLGAPPSQTLPPEELKVRIAGAITSPAGPCVVCGETECDHLYVNRNGDAIHPDAVEEVAGQVRYELGGRIVSYVPPSLPILPGFGMEDVYLDKSVGARVSEREGGPTIVVIRVAGTGDFLKFTDEAQWRGVSAGEAWVFGSLTPGEQRSLEQCFAHVSYEPRIYWAPTEPLPDEPDRA